MKELENLPDGPEYFQKRYEQEYDLLQIAKKEMEFYKIRYTQSQKLKKLIIERMCNLKDEIEEAKSPIIKLSKTLDNEAWKKGGVELLQHFGLADSIIATLKSEGFADIGKIHDDETWRDIPGFGEATAEKILSATAEMVDNFNAKLKELQEAKEAE